MSLENQIVTVVQAIGADIKVLNDSRGLLSNLNTTAKANVVAAINEVLAAVGGAGAAINDTAGNGATTVTWSADKIFDSIEAAKVAVTNSLVNGAAAALDTLSELATALGNDANFAATMATSLTKRIRFDAVQTLTAPEQLQACTNIGVGDPAHNFVTDYTTAKA
jgi:chemotaxis protein histidine kinase CheA